jgi:transposase
VRRGNPAIHGREETPLPPFASIVDGTGCGVGGAVLKQAYRYRFYPTPEQTDLLNRTFGCVRKVYNLALAERTRAYAAERRSMTYGDMSAALTRWKRDPDLAFLNEVSCVPLQQTCVPLQQTLRHLQAGFTVAVRAWTCPGCGVVHDRDVNAAKNLLAAGLAER